MQSTKTSTRDRLIVTARDLFYEQGYAATGIAQILKQADTKPGSLYHFFPSKEDLLIAVLESYKEMLFPAVMQPVFDQVSDPIERIFGVLKGYRQMLLLTECTKGCPIGNIALELADSHSRIRMLCAENFDGWLEAIRGCLDDASNRLPDTVDHTELASFVLSVMEGAVMQARAYRMIEPYDVAINQLRDYFNRLLDDAKDGSPPANRGRIDRGLSRE